MPHYSTIMVVMQIFVSLCSGHLKTNKISCFTFSHFNQ
uniref:Uncharacterized protein n=1 Tax=Anguilla anguilla TaxID=7936 RepID=A0A0E9SG27_ANGAN